MGTYTSPGGVEPLVSQSGEIIDRYIQQMQNQAATARNDMNTKLRDRIEKVKKAKDFAATKITEEQEKIYSMEKTGVGDYDSNLTESMQAEADKIYDGYVAYGKGDITLKEAQAIEGKANGALDDLTNTTAFIAGELDKYKTAEELPPGDIGHAIDNGQNPAALALKYQMDQGGGGITHEFRDGNSILVIQDPEGGDPHIINASEMNKDAKRGKDVSLFKYGEDIKSDLQTVFDSMKTDLDYDNPLKKSHAGKHGTYNKNIYKSNDLKERLEGFDYKSINDGMTPEKWEPLAKKHGVDVLWVGNQTNPDGSLTDEAIAQRKQAKELYLKEFENRDNNYGYKEDRMTSVSTKSNEKSDKEQNRLNSALPIYTKNEERTKSLMEISEDKERASEIAADLRKNASSIRSGDRYFTGTEIANGKLGKFDDMEEYENNPNQIYMLPKGAKTDSAPDKIVFNIDDENEINNQLNLAGGIDREDQSALGGEEKQEKPTLSDQSVEKKGGMSGFSK